MDTSYNSDFVSVFIKWGFVDFFKERVCISIFNILKTHKNNFPFEAYVKFKAFLCKFSYSFEQTKLFT